jgi:dihydroflavonol-4-reductase
MRFLVTGATGKVGNAVARRLADRGEDVVALVRDAATARELLPAGIELAVGDVTEPESLQRAANGIDGAFNCMGIFEQWMPDPAIFARVNADGARNVTIAARSAGARRVVHTSTFDVFEAERGGTVREDGLAQRPKGTPYERSKQRAEELVLAEADRGIEVVICNPSTVLGPGPWAGTGVDGFLRDAVRRRLPALPPGGMTLVFTQDVAAGHLAAFDRGRAGERYIAEAVDAAGRGWVPPTMPAAVASGLARTGEAVARAIRRPPLLAVGQLHFLRWEARADSAKAREELGIEFTPWRDAVRRTIAWMRETGRI